MNDCQVIHPADLLDIFRVASYSRNTIFLEGPPGIGKSEISYQFAREDNRILSEIRPAQWDATEVKGLADFGTDPKTGDRITIWTRPGYLPQDERCMLLVEEVDKCIASIQAALLELTLDRRIGKFKLPADCLVVLTANRLEDRSGSYAISKALGNRLQHFKLEPSNEDWERWALRAGIRIEILAYLRYRPAALHEFDPTQKSAVFPSPRQWAHLSKTLDSMDKVPTSARLRPQEISGHIGSERGAEFNSFMDMYQELPDPRKIDAAPDTAPVPLKTSARFAVVTALARSATATNAGARLRYIERMTDGGAPIREFQTIFVGDLTETKSPGLLAPEIAQWIIQDKGQVRA